jgi:hypothetical protein
VARADSAGFEKFSAGASLALTRREAEFFRDRVIQSAPHSLFALLLDRGAIPPRSDFPWQAPGLASASTRLSLVIEHARTFSEVMHGAPLLYNLMLAEKRKHLCFRRHSRAIDRLNFYPRIHNNPNP